MGYTMISHNRRPRPIVQSGKEAKEPKKKKKEEEKEVKEDGISDKE